MSVRFVNYIFNFGDAALRLMRWVTALVLFCGLSQSSTHGQYRFDYWTTDNGLPQNSVYSIIQTRDGYLWFTTLDGLVRYDGVRFTVFDQSNSPGLTSNRMRSLYEDRSGTLWIGTEGGLASYRDGVFKTLTTADGLLDNFIFDVQRDKDDGVLIGTAKGYISWRDGKLIPFPIQGARPNLAITFSSSGSYWTLSKDGLRELRDGQEKAYKISWLPGRPQTADTLFEDREGNLWAAAGRGNFYRVTKDGILRHFGVEDGLPDLPVRHFYEDSQGNIWFSLNAGGLIRFKDDSFTQYKKEDGLSSSNIWCVLEDHEGTFWIGTDERGINRLTRQFIKAYTTKDGLAGDNVYPIFRDHLGSTWIGTTTGLSHLIDGKVTNYISESPNVPPYLIDSIFEDDKNQLWIGILTGLHLFKDGKLIPSSLFESAVGRRDVWTIYQDTAENLWIGTDRGLLRIKDNQVKVFTVDQGLPSNEVRCIFKDRNGNLWFGTNGGVALLKDDGFTVYSSREGLGSNHIRTIHEDDDGVLWFGSYDGGLSRFKDGKFTNYKIENGLFNNGVFQILEDNHGNFWISCNRGIYRVSHQQLNDYADGKISKINCIAYGKQDGMINTECNGGRQPAGLKMPDGKLWFPTQAGVVIVDPDAVPFNALPPPVHIESVMVDRSIAAFAGGLKILPGQSSLDIQYTGLSYVKPEQVRFKYKMSNLDPDWIDAGTRRSVNYSYMPPGEYTFTVIASNSDSIWNNQGATIHIVVLPPFYRSWWFLSLAVLIVIGLAVVIYKWRVAQLQRRNAAQEAFSRRLIESQESERKRIAAELHDSLGQSLVIIKNRAALSLATPNDHGRLLDQMTEVSEAAAHAITEVKEIAYNLHPFQLDKLGLTTALESMLQNAANSSDIKFTREVDQIDGLLPKEAEINLYRIVQEGLNNMIKYSEATQAKVLLKRNNANLKLLIQDNGKGFLLDAPTGNVKCGLGLTSMPERAKMIGARYEIISAPDQGTTITLELNIKEKN